MKRFIQTHIFRTKHFFTKIKRFIQTRIFRTKHFFTKLKRLKQWSKIIWESEDWDYGFLLILMSEKLKRMEKLHREDGHSEESSKYAKEISEMKKDIDELIEIDASSSHNVKAVEVAKKVFNEDIAKKILNWWD